MKRKPIYLTGPSIAYIPLTRGQFSLVDRDSAESLCSVNWQAHWCRSVRGFYARTSKIVGGKKTLYLMHRQVLSCSTGFTPDHLNRNTLDNRLSNLRRANKSEQAVNRRRQSNNTSGYKGVSFDSHTGRWRSYAYRNGSMLYFGLHDTAEMASIARGELA